MEMGVPAGALLRRLIAVRSLSIVSPAIVAIAAIPTRRFRRPPGRVAVVNVAETARLYGTNAQRLTLSRGPVRVVASPRDRLVLGLALPDLSPGLMMILREKPPVDA